MKQEVESAAVDKVNSVVVDGAVDVDNAVSKTATVSNVTTTSNSATDSKSAAELVGNLQGYCEDKYSGDLVDTPQCATKVDCERNRSCYGVWKLRENTAS